MDIKDASGRVLASVPSNTMVGAPLAWADLYNADLRDADLRGANLRGANLRDSDLTGADLHYATLIDSDLTGANLTGANLSKADLSGANLTYVKLSHDAVFSLFRGMAPYSNYIWLVGGNPDKWFGCNRLAVGSLQEIQALQKLYAWSD